MSVHSLIIPQSADVLAALVLLHPAAVFSRFAGMRSTFPLISFLHKRTAGYSLPFLSFSPHSVLPLSLLPFFSPSFFLFPPAGGLATAGQTSRRGDARGSPMQLADSELLRQPVRSEREGWGLGDGEKEGQQKLDSGPRRHRSRCLVERSRCRTVKRQVDVFEFASHINYFPNIRL